jgi:23S rRNA (guanosine2251-2'-O)-methyltransferase
MRGTVRQLRGVEVISAALDQGCEVGLLLVQEAVGDARVPALVERARASGVPVREASASVLRRMTGAGEPADVLGLLGRRPQEDLAAVLGRGGAFWLLVDVAYPTNVGVAIRTAEGSGASGIAVDSAFDHSGRRVALRASMRADWYMPVFWERAERVIEAVRQRGQRVYAIENSGQRAPWEADLTGPVLLIIGGESEGIPAPLLRGCDEVLRVPMGGFIPSYNLQIPVGVVAAERLRQLAGRPRPGCAPAPSAV